MDSLETEFYAEKLERDIAEAREAVIEAAQDYLENPCGHEFQEILFAKVKQLNRLDVE